MKWWLARSILFLCEEVCGWCHHFNLLPDGRPGCIMNWQRHGYGPNRWASWALRTLGI